MISLILYGRNDNHGYNLHKRGAISLNAMSEVLTDPEDEIIFVDYNTPDDLPTFPEAIADTLTGKARERLRILRARPAVHAPFRSRTHLLALESISRNIALRRSNPSNRWVLSTNTDMIFVPRQPSASLTEIVSQLPDGFYQLPRFELPESLWESYDRHDGLGIITKTRDLAARFHLNETVYGSDNVLFDGPGDFQLCLRADLWDIKGFHEGMLRGWHVDANLCTRMIALRGEIRSLETKLFGYHCDHTRQVTTSHGHDRVENDAEEFVDTKRGPQLLEQADTWGLPNEQIEEFRLGKSTVFTRYLRSLETAIPTPQTERYESAYREESFGATEYRRAHVLPFVIDLIAGYPRGSRVLFAGARADMCADLASACNSLASEFLLITPKEFTWLDGADGAAQRPLAEALEEADLLVFEFGTNEPGQPADIDAKFKLASVRRALLAAATSERARGANKELLRRRFLAINAIHNEYESLISGVLAYTLTPFSSRLRHGYVLEDESAQKSSFDVRTVWNDLQKGLGRTRSIPLWETQELVRLARTAASTPAAARLPSEALVCAEALIALLRHDQVDQVCGVDRNVARATADRLEFERPGTLVRRLLYSRYGVAQRDVALKSLSRVADVSDWEKPNFARFVDQHFGGARAQGAPDRNLWTWERASVLDVLSEAHLLSPTTRLLLVTTVPDALAPALADYLERVDLARARGRGGPFITPCSVGDADPNGFEEGLSRWSADKSTADFDAVVFLQQSIMLRGPNGVPEALAEACRLVKPKGLILMSATTSLLGSPAANEFRAFPMIDGSFQEALRQSDSGLEFCGPLEVCLTKATTDRAIDHVREDLRYRKMLELRGRKVSAEAFLTFRRIDAAQPRAIGRGVLGRVIDVGVESDVRFVFWQGVRMARRVARRLRRELGALRSNATRRL